MFSFRYPVSVVIGAVLCLGVQTASAGEYVGGVQKGKGHSAHHGHHHCSVIGEAPPNAELFESVAIRRVPLERQTSFRVQQQARQGEFESSALEDDRLKDFERRLALLEVHVGKIYDSLETLIDRLSKQSD